MFITAYFTLLGLLVGSAINAIVWRLYIGRSWVKGRSECPECHHVLAAKDLVPVVSWLALGGKCRYCRAPIKDHPIVELVTALVFGLSAAVLAPIGVWSWVLFGLWLVILTLLIILAVYDTRWMLLPDKIMVPAIGLGLMYVVLQMVQTQSLEAGRGPLAAALIGGSIFYGLAIATKGRAMGGGDIKLVFLMGFLLGLKGLALALLLAFNSAALVGLALIATHRKRRRDQIPFGPFLVAATIVAFLYGRPIVDWYLQQNGLT